MLGITEDDSGKELSLDEINARLPRKVRLSSSARTMLLVNLVFFGAGAIEFGLFFHTAIHETQQRDALHRVGRETLATITNKTWSRDGITVQYMFRDGDVGYEGQAQKASGRLDARVGEQIPIRYLPSDPSANHPSEWEWSAWDNLVPKLFVLFFTLVMAAQLVVLYRTWTLAREGWVVDGKVTGCAKNGPRLRVYYEFRTGEHTLVEGSNQNSEEYEYGSSIRVIYLGSNPKRNDRYPTWVDDGD